MEQNLKKLLVITGLTVVFTLSTAIYLRSGGSKPTPQESEHVFVLPAETSTSSNPDMRGGNAATGNTPFWRASAENHFSFSDDGTFEELMDEWRQKGLMDEAQSRYIEYRWQKVCLEAKLIEHMRSPDQARRRTAVARSRTELKYDAAASIVPFCQGTEADSITTDNLALVPELRQRISSFRQYTSYDTAVDLLSASMAEGGVNSLHESALGLLADSIDEASIVTAIKHLISHRLVHPPFPGEGLHGYQRYHHVLIEDVATALLCDRIGGCALTHPFTIRRCLETTYGCLDPLNFEDAVRQLTPALEFQVFDTLLFQMRGKIASYLASN